MIVLLVGAPGAGKGTQADLIVADFPIEKLSTGDALRRQIAIDSDLGKQAAGFMSEGKLVPDEVLNEIVRAELSRNARNSLLLDGYPRTIQQAKALDHFCKVDAVIHIDVDIDVLVGRITGRRVCQECGANFHNEFAKPSVEGICDKCGGDLVQRPDDTEEKVRVRLDVYEKSTKPVIDFYRAQGLYKRVDGMASPTMVYQELKDILVPMFNNR